MSNPTPSERVIEAVAETTAQDPLELPPMFDTVDADALDKVVRSMDHGTVSFEYADYSVTVHSDGTVTLDGTPEAAAGTDEPLEAERASSV